MRYNPEIETEMQKLYNSLKGKDKQRYKETAGRVSISVTRQICFIYFHFLSL